MFWFSITCFYIQKSLTVKFFLYFQACCWESCLCHYWLCVCIALMWCCPVISSLPLVGTLGTSRPLQPAGTWCWPRRYSKRTWLGLELLVNTIFGTSSNFALHFILSIVGPCDQHFLVGNFKFGIRIEMVLRLINNEESYRVDDLLYQWLGDVNKTPPYLFIDLCVNFQWIQLSRQKRCQSYARLTYLENHNKDGGLWIVVNGKVYDVQKSSGKCGFWEFLGVGEIYFLFSRMIVLCKLKPFSLNEQIWKGLTLS